MRKLRSAQSGFLLIAAVFLLVVLTALLAYLGTVATTSQAASAADFNAARAYQAARAGIEWGAYQILRNPAGGSFKPACEAGTASFDLGFASTLVEFTSRVSCSSSLLTEGAASVRVYYIESTACNQPPCPSASTSATYVERKLSLNLSD